MRRVMSPVMPCCQWGLHMCRKMCWTSQSSHSPESSQVSMDIHSMCLQRSHRVSEICILFIFALMPGFMCESVKLVRLSMLVFITEKNQLPAAKLGFGVSASRSRNRCSCSFPGLLLKIIWICLCVDGKLSFDHHTV